MISKKVGTICLIQINIITSDLNNETYIKKTRNLSARGNAIVRKFNFCSTTVKCKLFQSYWYSLYCCSLWSKNSKKVIDRLRVSYNNVMRRLLGFPLSCSASQMFVGVGVRSFWEVMRTNCFSLMNRVNKSDNSIIKSLANSGAIFSSNIRRQWNKILFVD